MTIFLIWLGLMLLFGPMFWAMCKIAGYADRQDAETFARWQAERQQVIDE